MVGKRRGDWGIREFKVLYDSIQLMHCEGACLALAVSHRMQEKRQSGSNDLGYRASLTLKCDRVC